MKTLTTMAIIMIFFGTVSFAQGPSLYRKSSARRLIAQLNHNYMLLDRSLKELEDEIKRFPDTLLTLSLSSPLQIKVEA